MVCPHCKKVIPRCENCGPVAKVYKYRGTTWCKECLRLIKLEEEPEID